jgi:hypothetical protein
MTSGKLLTQAQAAERLGLTNPNTLAVWRCTKKVNLAYIKIGGAVRYDEREIERFIASCTVGGSNEN